MKNGWRYSSSDHTWHCFTEGLERSLCNAHELGRHGATADRQDIPVETRCPFCEAAFKRGMELLNHMGEPVAQTEPPVSVHERTHKNGY